MTFGARAAAVWALGAAALLVAGVSAVTFVRDYDAETSELVASLDRHRAIHETLTALLDDEAAESVFLATGDAEAWARVHAEHAEAHDTLARAFGADADAFLAVLATAVAAREDWTRRVLDLAAEGDLAGARAHIETGHGVPLLRAIREELDRLEADEESRVERHLAAVTVHRTRAGVALALGALLAILIVLGSLVRTVREARATATRARQAEERESRLRQLADAAVDLVRITDGSGKTTYVSPSALRLLGRQPDEVASMGDAALVPEDDRPRLDAAMKALALGRAAGPILHRLRLADDSLRWFETRLLPIHDDEGRFAGWQASSHDVHDRTLAEQAREVRHSMLVVEAAGLRIEATTDPLTGLLNRRGLLERAEALLATERAAGRTTAVVFGDLDGLKQVNDTFGHDAGDRMIRAAADALRRSARENDLCARVGGDEMVVIATGCDDAGAAALERRLLAELASHHDEAFTLAMSLGHALAVPDDETTLDDLLALADGRMYERKRTRKSGRAAE